MKRTIILLAAFLVLSNLSFLTVVPPATAQGSAFRFNLITPNTAEAASGPFAGDTITLTGGGIFDVEAGTIKARGRFTHSNSDGTVLARGIWVATSFDSFASFGGPNAGTQGGELELTVTVFPVGGDPVSGLDMTVTCLINAPSTFTEEEGTTLGNFTEKTGGNTQFHTN